MTDNFTAAAYGGAGWSPRFASLRQEIGTVWRACGVLSEWKRLEAVLLHRPGDELAALGDPDEALMLARPDAALAASQHDMMAAAYQAEGVAVHYVDPAVTPAANQMFVADLMFMTPEGAIVARPASTVRAGEERWVARRLADLGVPILRTVGGTGTFEGADAAWLEPTKVLLGLGLRTNAEGARQVAATLAEIGVQSTTTELPHGTMHLMGQLRLVDRDLAMVRRGRLSMPTMRLLGDLGFELLFFPDEEEASHGFGAAGPAFACRVGILSKVANAARAARGAGTSASDPGSAARETASRSSGFRIPAAGWRDGSRKPEPGSVPAWVPAGRAAPGKPTDALRGFRLWAAGCSAGVVR
jgi:arginine deiminase